MGQMRHHHGLRTTEWDTLIDEVLKQGQYLRHVDRTSLERKYKSDNSPYTECDVAVEDNLKRVMASFKNSYKVISEEQSDTLNADAIQSNDYVWCMDPIDGTKTFLDGYDEYTINVALLSPPDKSPPHNRTPVMGIVYAPSKGELYFTKPNGKAYVSYIDADGKPIGKPEHKRTSTQLTDEARISVGHGAGDQSVSLFTHKHPCVGIPYTGAYRSAMVVMGETDAALFRHASAIWDVAAPDAIMRAAGGKAYPINHEGVIRGTDLYYGADASQYCNNNLFESGPYIATNPHIISQLELRVEPSVLIPMNTGRGRF